LRTKQPIPLLFFFFLFLHYPAARRMIWALLSCRLSGCDLSFPLMESTCPRPSWNSRWESVSFWHGIVPPFPFCGTKIMPLFLFLAPFLPLSWLRPPPGKSLFGARTAAVFFFVVARDPRRPVPFFSPQADGFFRPGRPPPRRFFDPQAIEFFFSSPSRNRGKILSFSTLFSGREGARQVSLFSVQDVIVAFLFSFFFEGPQNEVDSPFFSLCTST